MTKRYVADHTQDPKPHRSKAPRLNRLSSPASTAASLSSSVAGSDMSAGSSSDKQSAAERRRAAEAMARYNEVNLLFNSQFPGLGLNSSSHQTQTSASNTAFSPDMGGGDTFSSSDDEELAFELNASMGLIWRPPPTQQQPDPLAAASYPWMTTTSPAATMTTTTAAPAMNDVYMGMEEGGFSPQGFPPALTTRSDSYPFTSPAAGELMVTASPADASYGRSPPRDTRAGEVVEDLGWLGERLQRNARMQLQELNEGGLNMPYVN